MEKKSNKSSNKFVEKLLELFDELDQEEFQKDIVKASKLGEKSKFIKSFLKKYSNPIFDEKTTKEINSEIISKLVNTREDFVKFMEIYMSTEDKIESEALRQHHILKEKKLTKLENGDLNGDTYLKFGISLSCIFDPKSYYDKFIKGMFRYFQLSFKEDYLSQYIKHDYFNNSNEFQFYKENTSSLENSLKSMLIDMKRIIFEHSKEEANKNSNKLKLIMEEYRFKLLIAKAHLVKNEEAKNIYKKCKNNDEILLEVNKLRAKAQENNDEELYYNLSLFEDEIKNYLEKEKETMIKADYEKTISNSKAEEYLNLKKIEKIEEEVQNLNKKNNKHENDITEMKTTINNLETTIKNQETTIKNYETTIKNHETTIKNYETTIKNHETTIKNYEITIKNHETTINSQQTTINNHETTIKKHETTINELKKKVEFMEPIVLSLICRKAINHSIIKILGKYKQQLKVVSIALPNNDIKYDITFINSVNGVNVKELNDLINKIFLRKDLFNQDSHLFNKVLPPFFQDLWDNVKKHLELNPNEIKTFDTLIDNEIKSSFDFGGEDISIKDYLKKNK